MPATHCMHHCSGTCCTRIVTPSTHCHALHAVPQDPLFPLVFFAPHAPVLQVKAEARSWRLGQLAPRAELEPGNPVVRGGGGCAPSPPHPLLFPQARKAKTSKIFITKNCKLCKKNHVFNYANYNTLLKVMQIMPNPLQGIFTLNGNQH